MTARTALGVSLICSIVCGCAMHRRESKWIEPGGEKHWIMAAIPAGSTIEHATNIMKDRGYEVDFVHDDQFVEGGNVVGGPPATAYLKHADFLRCTKTVPLTVVITQMLDVAIVVKDGKTAEILLNSFNDGVGVPGP